ncbi:hypothetical protein DN412_03255 [Cupriavidus lacunae]|uniref:HTH hxlR-type domain-containing protein n=2 Tax=Cupriavidus lacunae TaxID=2666307 RepID=A0A370P295_9BURK|nr:helix-turn-helix domain-containing protein [Cupriavidus lacunae]RDK11973.1 hypothetical protein DN412_03255 [Cupriavidus lacunae]
MENHSSPHAPDVRLAASSRHAIVRATLVLGERWSILIVREAFNGSTRFDEFARSLGIAPNILSARLKSLVARGVLTRKCITCGCRPAYLLTDRGRALQPTLAALESWADIWLPMDQGAAAPSCTELKAPNDHV